MKLKNITEIIFLPLLLVSGIVTGFAGVIPQWIIDSNLSSLLLALLVFQVGLGLSSRSDFSEIVRTISIKTLLLPIFWRDRSMLGQHGRHKTVPKSAF